MKYTNTNKPLVCMLTQSNCYKTTKNKNMTIKGVLWHSTGANNPNLRRYVQPADNTSKREHSANTYTNAEWLALLGTNTAKNDLNHTPDREIGLNCWIGKLNDGTVTTIQTMPWNYKPWGCASGSRGSCNDGWIQFEICEDGLSSQSYFNAVYKEACEITAYLCKMYNINPKGTVSHNGVSVPTILCHHGAYKLGLGSGHEDVDHWFPKFGKNMANARNDVAALLSGADFELSPDNGSSDDGFNSTFTFPTKPIEPALIRRLIVTKISTTSAEAQLSLSENYLKYSWSYSLTSLIGKNKGNVKTKNLNFSKKEPTIELKELIPNNTYLLEIFAKDTFDSTTKSPKIIFTTSQDYPKPVEKSSIFMNIKNFLKADASCDISFTPTSSWGTYSRVYRGYRTTLFINGKEIGYNDDFFKATSESNKNITLSSLLNTFKISNLAVSDTMQIGIQPWVKDENNNFIFAKGYPSCSKPIYLQHYIKTVDKVFLNVNNKNERVAIYLNV